MTNMAGQKRKLKYEKFKKYFVKVFPPQYLK